MICRVLGVCLLLMTLLVGVTLCAHAGDPRVVTSAAAPRVDLFEAPKAVAACLRVDLFECPQAPKGYWVAQSQLDRVLPLTVYVSSAINCAPCRRGERERMAIQGVEFHDIAELSNPPPIPRNIWPVYVWPDKTGQWWYATGWEGAANLVTRINKTPVARLLSLTQ